MSEEEKLLHFPASFQREIWVLINTFRIGQKVKEYIDILGTVEGKKQYLISMKTTREASWFCIDLREWYYKDEYQLFGNKVAFLVYTLRRDEQATLLAFDLNNIKIQHMIYNKKYILYLDFAFFSKYNQLFLYVFILLISFWNFIFFNLLYKNI